MTSIDVTILIVMGVSGSGKTTIGRCLANELEWSFVDADDAHSPENVAKMRRREQLTDEDRRPWLQQLRCQIETWLAQDRRVVLACSALKERYRAHLMIDPQQIRFVYLEGSIRLFQERLQHRTAHFMPAALLESQFALLEPPRDAIIVDAGLSPREIVEQITTQLVV
jgi:gluconokinase